MATKAWLPILEAYTKDSGIEVDIADISLTGRIIANFPDNLTEDQKIDDHLSELGTLVKQPETNVMTLSSQYVFFYTEYKAELQLAWGQINCIR